MKINTFLLAALVAVAATATAIPAEDLGIGKRRLANDPVTDQQLADAKANYKGIYWETAADSCTSSQFAILMESTRVALDIMSWDYRSSDSPGFTRFFGDATQFKRTNRAQFQKIIDNLRQVADFPRLGRKDKQSYQISYYCGDVQHYTNCLTKSASGLTVPAYTIHTAGNTGRIDGCPLCNAIGFCDTFWSTRVRYTNDVLEDKPALNDLASISTYEHVLIHEWMHNDITQVRPHISDVKDYLYDPWTWGGKQNVYGALNCARYGVKYFTKVNTMTLENADSYAWMLTNNYFNAKLGWSDTGTTQLPFQKRSLAPRDDAPAPLYPLDFPDGDDDADLIVDAALLTAPDDHVPDNCESEPGCEYLGDETEEEWEAEVELLSDDPLGVLPFRSTGGCVLSAACHHATSAGGVDAGCTCTCDGRTWSLTDDVCAGYQGSTTVTQPADFNCNCGESGCSADSMACCANGSCECHCGESGCDAGDPTCCASGTCAPLSRMLRMGRM